MMYKKEREITWSEISNNLSRNCRFVADWNTTSFL